MPARLLPYGDRAVLVVVDDLDQALALHDLLADPAPLRVTRPVPTLADLVLGARTVLLVGDSAAALPEVRDLAERAMAALAALDVRAATATALRPPAADQVVEVPVHYDGEDLAVVAELTGLSVGEVVGAHTSTPWRVGFAGFAPGFAYLVDGDPRLRVPRRTSPRARVPAGAVGLADEFSGVYPRESPGGWQLLGHTDLALWDLRLDPPALLRPGLWVRFTDLAGAS